MKKTSTWCVTTIAEVDSNICVLLFSIKMVKDLISRENNKAPEGLPLPTFPNFFNNRLITAKIFVP
jgi:hypothetical protein